ncbi:MAG TPA: DNA topoisomerase IB [Sandaracinaceae bacterium LLY-WYZ-13_1]|nr:DNA topoisomerase IB [Sandaracinaceae bacterium LLY-WYZ-13_1]
MREPRTGPVSLDVREDMGIGLARTLGVETEETGTQPFDDALVHTTDGAPGIRRRRCGRGWAYRWPDGALIRDPAVRARIASIAVPPAWTDVWICPRPNGHLQATGRDDRGRKQYRYHPLWCERRRERKFDRLPSLGLGLPALHARVRADLRAPRLSRRRVVAAVVTVIAETFVRIGHREYTRENGSYGATTLRDEHVSVEGARLRLCFVAKGGREREIEWRDRAVARVVRRCHELPCQHLFSYRDPGRGPQPVRSDDVNAYLEGTLGPGHTAKALRTWGGTLRAFERLRTRADAPDREAAVREVLAEVAGVLGNTRRTTEQHYVHPRVIEAYREGALHERPIRRAVRRGSWYGASFEDAPFGHGASAAGLLCLLDGDAVRRCAA